MMNPNDCVIALLLSLIVCPAAADHEDNAAQFDRMESLQSRVITLEQKIEEIGREHKEVGPGVALRTQSGTELAISGQVNRALIWADDGEEDYLFHVDNSASSSKLRFIAEKGISGELTVGSALEFDFRVNNSFTVGQGNSTRAQDGPNFRDRRVEIWIDNPDYGRFWMGKGPMGSDDSSEQDLSGTYTAGNSDPGVMGGGMRFRNAGGVEDTPRIFDVMENMDGMGRDVRLRYDTPTSWLPFQLRISSSQGDAFDASIFYDDVFMGRNRINAAIAYSDTHRISGNYRNTFNGSFSILFDQGLNITAAGGTRQRLGSLSRVDPSFIYLKLGYRKGIWETGNTAFSIDYQNTQDLMQDGDSARLLGLQMLQNFKKLNLDAYISARVHYLDRINDNFESLQLVMTGIRFKF